MCYHHRNRKSIDIADMNHKKTYEKPTRGGKKKKKIDVPS